MAVGGSLTTARNTILSEAFFKSLALLAKGSHLSRHSVLINQEVGCGFSLIDKKDMKFLMSHGALPTYDAEVGDYVGNLSTRPDNNQPGSAPAKSANVVYIIVDKSTYDATLPFPCGAAFKGNKFSFLPELDGRSNYMIVAVTIAFITGWGVEHVKTGEMSDEVNQFLISNHAWAFSWKELIITYNEAQGQAIQANLSALHEFLPDLPSGVSVEVSPFCSWRFLTPDEQERREGITRKNKENLAQFLTPPFGGSIAVGGSVVGASPGMDLDDLSAVATQATPQQQQQSQSAAQVAKRWAMYKLFGATVVKGVLVPPEFREGIEDILRETSKKEGATMLASQLKEIDEGNDDSRDRLLHQSHFTGAEDEVQMGFLFHLKGGGKTTSMKAMSTTSKGFTSLVFMEDNHTVRKQREALAKGREIRDIEDMQEESEANRTKLDTTILVADNIAHLGQLKTLLANCVLFCMSVYDYDPVKNESNAPIFHSMAFRFEATLASRAFRDWFDTLSTYAKAEFQYWLLTQIETILQYLLEMCSSITHLPKAKKDNFGGIPVTKHNHATDLVTLAVDQMVTWVTSGAVSTSASALFQSSTYYQRKLEAEKKAAVAEATAAAAAAAKASLRTPPHPRNPPPHGRQSYHTPGAGGPVLVPPPQPPRVSGEIISTAREFPKLDRSTLGGCHLLCIAHIRHGTRGCMYKDTCQFDHPASIKDWHPSVLSAYQKLVESTPTLSWNKEMIPSNLFAQLKIE